MKWIMFSLIFTLLSCATQPKSYEEVMKSYGYEIKDGKVEVSKSKFDKLTTVYAYPASTYYISEKQSPTSFFKIGFSSNNKLYPKVFLLVKVRGAMAISHLAVNIDGKRKKLKPYDKLTDIHQETLVFGNGVASATTSYNVSERRFLVSVNFLKKLLKAKEVFFRLYDIKNNYIDASFYVTTEHKKVIDAMWENAGATKIKSSVPMVDQGVRNFLIHLSIINKD